ncbi:MAG: hypothetical protein Kow0074_25870 [Candidatus Zixiibacteriota bacterium]
MRSELFCTTNRRRLYAPLAAMVIAIVGLPLIASLAMAQGTQGRMIEDKTIDATIQKEIIDSVCMALDSVYVFPDVARRMAKHVRDLYKKGEYKQLTSTREFTMALTEDLRDISHDRHLRIRFASDEEIEMMLNDSIPEADRQRMRRERQRSNYGWKEVKILPGNVGYVDLRGFSDASEAGFTAIAAMNFLAYTDAIIFDLRQNGGGSPSMIQLISSYLFDGSKHLNSFYIRAEDTIRQFWTQEYVVGPRLTNADVYVLTSNYTFSAAEEFTYNLKNMERATIVGETTGGGAHPVEGHVFANINIAMSVPFGRAINPITGTNWEGTGVAPDIECPQEEAFDIAYAEALKSIRDRLDDNEAFEVNWVLQGLEAKRNPVTVDAAKLAKYAGSYGPRTLTLKDGHLIYQRAPNPPMVMIPMSETMFRFDEIDYFRLEVVLDNEGNPVEIIGHYDDGRVDKSVRDDTQANAETK